MNLNRMAFMAMLSPILIGTTPAAVKSKVLEVKEGYVR